jgi:hypothetical protein
VTYPSPVSATRPKVGQRTELALYRHGGRTNYLRPANRRSGPNHRPVHARGRSGLPRRPWAIDHGRTRRTRRQLPPAGSRARLPARAVPEWLPLSNRHPGLRARLNRWPTRGQDAVQNCQEVRRWHRALARPKRSASPADLKPTLSVLCCGRLHGLAVWIVSCLRASLISPEAVPRYPKPVCLLASGVGA